MMPTSLPNELSDQQAKEAATSNDINECYSRMPKSTMKSELSESSVKKSGKRNGTVRQKVQLQNYIFPK
jgi:hypothetical protein